jgi:hypothetical protein
VSSVSLESSRANGRAGSRVSALAAPVGAAILGVTSIVVGIMWDMSWHRSIGRDTFWTPAHMAIYLGGLLAGAAAGALVLRATSGVPGDRARAVSIGPLRGPLGAFLMIWGATAMVASAPFDDWWHNAYGLDVKVLSPPHVVLAVGMIVVVTGALVLAVSARNRADVPSSGSGSRRWDLTTGYASGVLLTFAALFVIEFTFPLHQHAAIFYEVTAAVFPLLLVALARASRRRHAATVAALVYMALVSAMNWILPLFPAEARLAPIYNPITRMVPFCFPLLLVFPALAIDALVARRGARNATLLALVLGAAFVLVLLAVQWPFADFQMAPASRNWFFVGDRYWSYSFHPNAPWRYGFDPKTPALTSVSVLLSAAIAAVSSRLGLAAGSRLSRVVR